MEVVAFDGDTIHVIGPGLTYPEPPITIKDGQTVLGGTITISNGGGGPIGGGTFTFTEGPCTSAVITGNGSGPIFTCAGSATIRGLTFTGNGIPGNGAGIRATAGYLVVANCCFDELSAGGGGGAISQTGGSMTLTSCDFSSNAATGTSSGGGVYARNTTVLIRSCRFLLNEAGTGGACAFDTCDVSFLECPVVSDNKSHFGNGGAIWAIRRSLLIEACTFNRNESAGAGGALGLERCNATVKRAIFFRNNSHGGFGGGISSEDTTDLTLREEIVFEGNIAAAGGGMALGSLSKADLEDVTIRDHIQSRRGAGIAVLGDSSIEMRLCTLSGNESQGNGGGVFASESADVTLSLNDFQNNRARISGGGLCLEGESTLRSSTDRFTENHANRGNGGGAYLTHSTASFEYAAFLRNTVIAGAGQSGGNGGGLACEHCEQIVVSGEPGFDGNLADHSAGAIYLDKSGLECRSSLTNNTARVDGGGVLLTKNSSATFSGILTIRRNHATIRRGGALACSEGSRATLDGSVGGIVLEENTAETDGGGVDLRRSQLDVIRFVLFFKNTAQTGSGGAVAVVDQSSLTASGPATEGALFLENHSSRPGSAVYSFLRGSASQPSLTHARFSLNVDQGVGGPRAMVASIHSGALLDHCGFTNLAGTVNNALYAEAFHPVALFGVTCRHVNVAPAFTNALLAVRCLLTIEDTTLGATTATGVDLTSAHLEMSYCSVYTTSPVQISLVNGTVAGVFRTELTGYGSAIGVRVSADSDALLRDNAIVGHANFGVQKVASGPNPAPTPVRARYNWWGHPLGPTHPGNPGGGGDRVSDFVAIQPPLGAVPSPVGPR
ncbi:MAG: hypothetical protein HYY93_06485 [Planctomycetes bacterium]|nr:hypothetical protein [Planctomycetota bacterium]